MNKIIILFSILISLTISSFSQDLINTNCQPKDVFCESVSYPSDPSPTITETIVVGNPPRILIVTAFTYGSVRALTDKDEDIGINGKDSGLEIQILFDNKICSIDKEYQRSASNGEGFSASATCVLELNKPAHTIQIKRRAIGRMIDAIKNSPYNSRIHYSYSVLRKINQT